VNALRTTARNGKAPSYSALNTAVVAIRPFRCPLPDETLRRMKYFLEGWCVRY
jgi:hypothetical protein